jgi:hypothetical protein
VGDRGFRGVALGGCCVFADAFHRQDRAGDERLFQRGSVRRGEPVPLGPLVLEEERHHRLGHLVGLAPGEVERPEAVGDRHRRPADPLALAHRRDPLPERFVAEVGLRLEQVLVDRQPVLARRDHRLHRQRLVMAREARPVRRIVRGRLLDEPEPAIGRLLDRAAGNRRIGLGHSYSGDEAEDDAHGSDPEAPRDS